MIADKEIQNDLETARLLGRETHPILLRIDDVRFLAIRLATAYCAEKSRREAAEKECDEARSALVEFQAREAELRKALNGRKTGCPACHGVGWYDGTEPDEHTGEAMQVQIECENCAMIDAALSHKPPENLYSKLMAVVRAARADHDRTPIRPGSKVASCVKTVKGCIICSALAALDEGRGDE